MRCPHCKETFESIGVQYNGVVLYEVYLHKGALVWEEKEVYTDDVEDIYCPNCGKSLNEIYDLFVKKGEKGLKKVLKEVDVVF